MKQMEATKMFEVVYEATATCVVHVEALDKESAERMIQTGEAGTVEDDFINYERKIINCSEIKA